MYDTNNNSNNKGSKGFFSAVKQRIGMRIHRYRERLDINVTGMPHHLVTAVLIGTAAVEALAIGLILTLNLLPMKFLLLFLFIIIAIDAGILALILNKKRGRKRAYTGLIISLLVMILFLPASYFMYSTGDALQRISAMRDQWEDFYVIALEKGSYEELNDIKDKEVHAIDNASKMIKEANERLITTADVEIKGESDIISLANQLQDEQGGLHDNLIFTSESYYDIQCEELKDFKKNTKVIYTMKVKKRSKGSGRRINVTEDPFNVYITGLDSWGSIDKVSRSDVNMIMTVNPQTRQILLTSIPRDAYVELHSFGQMDKLTHSGIYGVEETIDTVQDWLDTDMDFYVKVNFSMLIRLIEAVGNIDVYSDEAFESSVSKYSYKKGWNNLHGKQALFFARERKSFEKGDAKRIKNQQRVAEALIRKITNSRVLLTRYNMILDAVSENMVTNMRKRDISALVRMQLRDMDKKWTVNTYSIACTEASEGTYSMGMGRKLFVNIPKEESVEKAKKMIHDTMYPAEAVEETNLIP